MPLGYHLYAAAKRMNALCRRALMFFLFWKPQEVCAVLGTHQELTSVKGTKANKAPECVSEIL